MVPRMIRSFPLPGEFALLTVTSGFCQPKDFSAPKLVYTSESTFAGAKA